jgi:hypothetical protein
VDWTLADVVHKAQAQGDISSMGDRGQAVVEHAVGDRPEHDSSPYSSRHERDEQRLLPGDPHRVSTRAAGGGGRRGSPDGRGLQFLSGGHGRRILCRSAQRPAAFSPSTGLKVETQCRK